MIKHIVFFSFKDYAESSDKKANIDKAKKLLDELPDRIDVILGWQTGINIVESGESADLVLVAEFKDTDALMTYQNDPEHQRVVAFLRKVRSERRVVDFEY